MNAPGSMMLAASALDTLGNVSQVQFFSGATSLGTVSQAPYTLNWNNIPVGNYSITAKAMDSGGATGASAPINLTVLGPTISLTRPTASQTWNAPAYITLTATASSTAGAITQVQFFNGSTLLGTAMQSPYTVNWSNVEAGSYTITAVATDSTGTVGSTNQVNITVNPAIELSVILTSPTSGATLTAPATLTLNAMPNVGNATISQVAFYSGPTLLGTATQAPYSITVANAQAGNYVLVAQVTDSAGATAVSDAVLVTVGTGTGGGLSGTDKVYDIHTDQLNTPRVITDVNGNVVWQWGPDEPFGDTVPVQTSLVFNLRFPGQYYDQETGTHYNFSAIMIRRQGATWNQIPLGYLEAIFRLTPMLGGIQ
jgi:hypothetical protein